MNGEDNTICVPVEYEAEGKEVAGNSNTVPERSKGCYKRTYEKFIAWKSENKCSSLSENVILDYFKYLNDKWKPTSLWTEYSKLKTMLIIKDQTDITIHKKVLDFLKKVSKGYQTKKAETFSQEHLDKFLSEAPDNVFLLYKVAVIFGVMGACRRNELHKLKMDDVQDLHDNKILLVRIMGHDNTINRQFTVTGEHYDKCKKYLNLRPADCFNPYFFVRYYKGKCSNQNVGINSFGQMGKVVADYLELPNSELYTGHSFRRTGKMLTGEFIKPVIKECVPMPAANRVPVVNLQATELGLQAPGPSRESWTQWQSEEDSSDTNTSSTQQPPVLPELLNLKRCCFCGDYTKYCVEVTEKPYVVNNRTSITLNGLSLDLDFNNTLPKSVCRHCDAKLQEMYDFIKQVKEAQDTLDVAEEKREDIETLIIKTELPTEDDSKDGIVDSVTFSDIEYVQPNITHKRRIGKEISEIDAKKQKQKVTKVTHKQKKVNEECKSGIITIDIIKEEVIDEDVSEVEMENYEVSHIGVKLSEQDVKLDRQDLVTRDLLKNIVHDHTFS